MRLRRIVSLLASLGAILISACSAATSSPGPAVAPGASSNTPVNPNAPGLTAPAPIVSQSTPLPAASPTPLGRASDDPTAVVVFAASTLGGPFSDLAGGFMLANSGSTGVTYRFENSALLGSMIQQGADADVLVSADAGQFTAFREAGLIDGPDAVLTHDPLVIVVSKTNPQGIQSLNDLARPGVRYIVTAPSDPTSAALQAVLDAASGDPAYGADFRTRADRNVLARDGNGAFVVSRIAAGEVNAGVVHASDIDLDSRQQIQIIGIPEAVNSVVEYRIAVLKNGTNARGGHAFMDYALSPPAQQVFSKWGFSKGTPGGGG